jgi:two-component system cell cycle response regulator DivK
MTQKDSEVSEPNKSLPKNQPESPQEIVKTPPEETKAGSDSAATSPDVKAEPEVVKTPSESKTGSDTDRVPRPSQDEKEKEVPAADNGKEKPGPGFDSVDPSEAHVLVVEDNVPNFVLIARMLAYMGVQRCEWKTSGWQVVEFADTLPRIDLILMDIRLPYEDGFQALEKVRSNPRLKDTLVVAVTAEASVEQMRRAKEAGFDGFLGKPLDPDRFPDQVRRVLSGEPVWEIH